MIVAFDGMPLGQPRPFEDISLAPGQRCDVIGDVSDEIAFADEDTGQTIGRIVAHGQRQRRTTVIPALPPNPMPQPKGREVKARLLMQGGAGGGNHGGFGTWALNDVSGLPREPLLNVRRGTTARISLYNATAFDHVMHLHGHHFWEISNTWPTGGLPGRNLGPRRCGRATFSVCSIIQVTGCCTAICSVTRRMAWQHG